MKKAIIFVLVLVVVISSNLFAETLDCQQAYELGKNDAKEEHKVLGWYFFGLASGLVAYGTVTVIGAGLSIPIFVTPFIPALVYPTRSNITPHNSRGNLTCYRDGYKRRAALKNCGAVFLGEFTALTVFVVGSLVAVSSFSGG